MTGRVKLTKTQLRGEQSRLVSFEHYLPTLQLKKALLQQEINEAKAQERQWLNLVEQQWAFFETSAPLFSTSSYNPLAMVSIGEQRRSVENIAGIDLPQLVSLKIDIKAHTLLDSPLWLEAVLIQLKGYRESQVQASISAERVALLQEELRQVSIRVNLFERVLIPKTKASIRAIATFLGDQQLAAIGRAKVAKAKKEQAARG